jgi:UDP:flavonoid glycosyltransferase YjiC (YdhE family)
MESLAYGVPMVLIPQQFEQFMYAQRAVVLGLGIQLAKDALTPSALREAVEHVAQTTTYRENVRQMQRVIHEEGGYLRGVDAIIQFTQKHVSSEL